MDDNLSALAKTGKCVVKKWAEKFLDPNSGLEGLIYIVKRVESPTFDPKGVPEGTALPSLVVESVKGATSAEAEAGQFYDEWGDKVRKRRKWQEMRTH